MTNLEDRVIKTCTVGSASSIPEGVKLVFLVRRGRAYLVEEQTAYGTSARTFDSHHRKRDSERAYIKASSTTKRTLELRSQGTEASR